MKKLHPLIKAVLLLLIFIQPNRVLFSQIVPQCGNAGDTINSSSRTAASISTACAVFLNDLTPFAKDSVLEVHVRFYVLAPTNSNGYWGANTSSDADYLLYELNNQLASLDTIPNLAGVHSPGDARIKLTKLSFDTIHSDSLYYHIDYASNHIGPSTPDALCIYFGYCTGLSNDVNVPNTQGPLPSKIIRFPAYSTTNMVDVNAALIHELGHALGLEHTQESAGILQFAYNGYSSIAPGFDCCPAIVAGDYQIEDFTTWGTAGVCGATPPQPYSNNVMGYNWQCKRFLSPQQLGIEHYSLRTNLSFVLTPQSYLNAVRRNPLYDFDITSDVTWTTNRYFKGNITVKNGHKLTVQCAIAMSENASIIVEPGAQLIIDGGEVTNISGRRWKGIEVAGTYTANQYIGSGGYSPSQGVLRVINGGKLSHSENAVKNHKKDSLGATIWTSTGGIIIANTANFINNTRDVEFLSYHGGPSVSNFYNCQFKTTGAIGKDASGSNAFPLMHVSLWDIEGVSFLNCSFQYSAATLFTNHGIGIASSDASYLIDKTGTLTSTFSGLETGIKSENSNPLRLPSISNTDFVNIVTDAAYFRNMNSLVFENNTIGKLNNGLYLNNCKNYNIKNNSFINSTPGGTGMYTYYSQDGGHMVYRNVFNNLNTGIIPVGNNGGTTGLKMNCNDFSATPNTFDIAMMNGPSVLIGSSMVLLPAMRAKVNINQGSINTLVRNIYGAASTCSICENEWFIEGVSTGTINHPANSNSNCRPEPQPDKSDIAIAITNNGQPLNYSIECPINEQSSGGSGSTPSQRMANTYTYISGLKALNSRGDYDFEIQATAATQLNYFLADTLPASKDSVISLLENNRGNFPDADILTVYAYMHKGDYTGAATKISALTDRTAWATLLTKQLDFAIYPEHLYNLADSSSDFLAAYAAYDTLDGSSAAQSLLNQFGGGSYSEPRPLPSYGSAARLSHSQNNTVPGMITPTRSSTEIMVYPNPASDAIQVFYQHEVEHVIKIVMTDALGKAVYESQAQSNSVLSIPLRNTPNGIYLLNAYDGKAQVYRSKIIVMK